MVLDDHDGTYPERDTLDSLLVPELIEVEIRQRYLRGELSDVVAEALIEDVIEESRVSEVNFVRQLTSILRAFSNANSARYRLSESFAHRLNRGSRGNDRGSNSRRSTPSSQHLYASQWWNDDETLPQNGHEV